MERSQPILSRLMGVIESRKADRPSGSYTTMLLEAGIPQITMKIREESEELVEAATDMGCSSPRFVIHEAADLFYHTLVLLAACGISLDQVEAELESRFGLSGLDEKVRRKGQESIGQVRSD
ncbi:MAG: phosphoribosyl-ATP diphosphatase [Thermoguttaceae bacterium]